MKVLLIRPTIKLTKKSLDYLTIPIPLGLAYIAAYLERNGHEIGILDALALGWKNKHKVNDEFFRIGLSSQEIKGHIKNFKPDVVGITNPFTSQVGNMHYIAKLVKEVDTAIPVVAGGVHPSSMPEDCLGDRNIDYIVKGEGEKTFSELLDYLSGKREINSVKSVYHREGNSIIFTGERKPITDLDSLPMPAYHLLPMEKYFEAALVDLTVRGGHHERWAMIVTSRGCPYHCCFCSVHLLEGRVWRARSPENVVKEIEYLKNTYNINRFTFEDSNFTLDIERVEKICDLLVERNLDIIWSLPNGVRVDRITKRLVDKMKAAGCVEITVAVEHGDQKFIDEVIHKNINLQQVSRSIKIIREAGISVSGFFVLGIPPENKETASKTMKFAVELSKLGMVPQINIAIPLPATEMAENCLKQGYIDKLPSPDEYLLSTHSKPIIRTNGLSSEELIKLRRKMLLMTGLTILLYHPHIFFRFPFIQQTIRDLVTPGRISHRIYKLRSLFNI